MAGNPLRHSAIATSVLSERRGMRLGGGAAFSLAQRSIASSAARNSIEVVTQLT
jgi:hypothetical protein